MSEKVWRTYASIKNLLSTAECPPLAGLVGMRSINELRYPSITTGQPLAYARGEGAGIACEHILLALLETEREGGIFARLGVDKPTIEDYIVGELSERAVRRTRTPWRGVSRRDVCSTSILDSLDRREARKTPTTMSSAPCHR